ncbi:alkaline phosphatase D family protein [Sphingoaurantiacus capsulatus]|uniref:Alkaline phosphatase D family protein n=1 Tax=Sphingoaurantiacus capsulatus TaxID=1771310 RepID=A0ABV7X7V6_9SPHN
MIDLRRRSLLKGGLFGAGALAAPAAAIGVARGFTHGVASGEPRATSVLLWTRYVPATGAAAPLRFEVAEDPGFGRIVSRGEAVAEAGNDYCAKPTATGLTPGRWYYYRFTGPEGAQSIAGRTRTLPEGGIRSFRIAAFSCANKPFGWFNAYAHAAARNDLDLVVHLGDYIYEYPRGDYPSERDALAGRPIAPSTEIVHLADYRARYASYRDDPDLQRLHQLYPSLNIWDDHEITNDAWKGGAQNHQPETEGDWEARKTAAKKAFREWLPMSDADYDSYEVGDLLTLVRLETRLVGRDAQPDLAGAIARATDLQSALESFRDGPLADPKRSMMGAKQEAWVGDQLTRSVRGNKRWQLVAQQVLMGGLTTARDASADWLGENPSERTRSRFTTGLAAAKAGIPFNPDAWGGYPAARARLLSQAQNAGANFVTIAGDSHNAWAFDLTNDGKPAGVEFGTNSVTSPGFEWSLRGVAPTRLAQSLVSSNPELKWCDTSHRGYMALTFTPDEVRCDWQLLDTIRERSATCATKTARVAHGARRMG